MAKQTTTTKEIKSKKKGNPKGIKGKGPKDKNTKVTRGQGQNTKIGYNLILSRQISTLNIN